MKMCVFNQIIIVQKNYEQKRLDDVCRHLFTITASYGDGGGGNFTQPLYFLLSNVTNIRLKLELVKLWPYYLNEIGNPLKCRPT